MVVVREDYKADTAHYTHLIVPDVSTQHDRDAVARARKWHRGTVLAKGAPALTAKGVEVPHGFEVGDTVLFHWNHYEKGFTRPWSDGEPACWVPQVCVDAVVEA
jgi:co-chaperonin GroES (HSP10)